MSTKRYFYTDALASAWMSKHFGMKFKSARGQNLYFDGGGDFRCEKDCGIYGGEYYFIAPDSLSILEPMVGDVVQHISGIVGVIEPTAPPLYWYVNWLHRDYISSLTFVSGGEYKIIQRNGIVFMQPESDEV